MKFLKLQGDDFVFHVGKKERELLRDLARQYPLLPGSHPRIRQTAGLPEADSDQKLLEEALADQRKENRKELEHLLGDPGRFRATSVGFHLLLNRWQIECLLQVLNDVRVGCWVLLGSPDEKHDRPPQFEPHNAHYLWDMELCGYFQAALLAAWDSQ